MSDTNSPDERIPFASIRHQSNGFPLREETFGTLISHADQALLHNSALRVLKMLVQAHAGAALPQDARQRRPAHLDRLPPKVIAVQLQQVEGVEECLGLVPPWRSSWNEVTPFSSQHTTSPSIRQDRTLRWFTASTTSG